MCAAPARNSGSTANVFEALASAGRVTGQPTRDVNYIMPRFVLDHLPLGMAGLFIAAVMAAAMSSIAAELNSLSTATVIDFYKRWYRPEGSDAHYLAISKAAKSPTSCARSGISIRRRRRQDMSGIS